MADFIYNNNYILSNMDAQKLYAQSPLTTGVSGTSAWIGIEPSARYNETVLWEGNNVTGTTAQLSESKNNFEYINVEYIDQNAFIGVTQFPASGTYFGFNLTTDYPNSNTQIIYRFGFLSAVDNTHLNYFKGGRIVFSTGANDFAMSSPPNIQRIVGINRKENV